jgi:hypothetical protein
MMPDTQPPAGKRSWISLWTTNRITVSFAAVGMLAALAAASVLLNKVGVTEFNLLRILSNSDEAPIRVRNGSLDLVILSKSQSWRQAGSSGNWHFNEGQRYRDIFDVTVTVRPGATCGGQSASGAEIIFTYSNDKKIRLQSLSRKTWVKPDTGVTMTWNGSAPQTLSYVTSGFLKSIETSDGSGGLTTMCSFTAANQLDHVAVLNTP